MAEYAMFIDTSKCTGCRACQVACKNWNGLPAEETDFWGTYENPKTLTGNTWTKVKFNEKVENGNIKLLFAKIQCMHCNDASCMAVCATKAISRRPGGMIVIDQNRCVGCRNCVTACPFGAVNFSEETGTPRKCRLCEDRVAAGLQPACVNACLSGALNFGERSEMLALAKKRQKELLAAGEKAIIYGEKELGGTHVIYLLTDEPEAYGLPKDPEIATSVVPSGWTWALAGLGLIALFPLRRFTEARKKGGEA
ncbi:MAG: 4Fe-4S ferredoxin iron-sulfur binding domain protein [Thermoanaerobacterales bacterium 50_218]|nr:MAG: 4Fe-4S ferredoxin iron-sulfur binding domain protein [Thermoanaerobacterales bacterium 50_218]HAA89608.1 4Fe-4S ferredoxin [Peptococcaceae bacterium]